MPTPDELITSLTPDLKAGVYAFGGALLSHAWSIFRGRRTPLVWTATFQLIKPASSESAASKVSVLMNGHPCPNLQSCQITVTNASGRDVEGIDLLFQFYAPFVIIEAEGGINSSGKNLLLSDGFTRTLQSIASLSETERPSHTSYSYYLSSREFHLPALNRGETATFKFWINTADPASAPKVIVTTEKSGVKMVSTPANFQTLNVAELRRMIPFGVIIAFFVSLWTSHSSLSTVAIAMISLTAGIASGVIGILFVHFSRWIRRVV